MKEFLSDVNNDLPLDTRWLSNIPDQTSWRQLPDRNINFCKYFREKSFLMEALNIPMGGQIWQILPDIVRLTFLAL